MEHEIVIKPVTAAELNQELEALVQYFCDKRITQCEIVLGRSLQHTDDIKQFIDKCRSLPLHQLKSTIDHLRTEYNIDLGDNDIFITIADHTFRFCSDSDIHLHYASDSDHCDHFYERWNQLGYKPVEWVNSQKGYAGEIIRHY